jgi:hypothetical protein
LEVIEIEKAEPAPLEHFDFVVQSFHEAVAGTMIEVVQDMLPSITQGLHESLQGFQGTGFHSGNPMLQPKLGFLTVLQVKCGPKLVFQVMAKLQRWRSGIEFW